MSEFYFEEPVISDRTDLITRMMILKSYYPNINFPKITKDMDDSQLEIVYLKYVEALNSVTIK